MPPSVRFKGGDSKRIFREAVQGLIPDVVFSRRDKMGFPVPLAEWFRGPIRGFVCDTLLSERARSRGLFQAAGVERLLAAGAPFDRQLWGLLSLELWFQAFIDRDRLPPRSAVPAAAATGG
jgi:asparagine synthase (glutamine-hydrolysing)